MEADISKNLANKLFLNKSVIHRGPDSMVSAKSLVAAPSVQGAPTPLFPLLRHIYGKRLRTNKQLSCL